MGTFNPSDKYPELLSVFKGKANISVLRKRIMNYLGVVTPVIITNHIQTMVILGYLEPSKTENDVFTIKVKLA